MRGVEPDSVVSDAATLVAAASDVAAFERFYRRYVRRVAGFAAQRCTSAEDVADVVAQTFARLIDAAGRYDPDRGEPAPFVLGIAANVVRDLHRREHRHRALIARVAAAEMLDDDDIERAEAAIDAARTAGAVHDALADVPPGEQAMLRLVAEGHTPGEAAAALGISPGAGWTRLARARKRLRTLVLPGSSPHGEVPRGDEGSR
jgi:RNA polymerase sigma-70 factor, ECF subfamily